MVSVAVLFLGLCLAIPLSVQGTVPDFYFSFLISDFEISLADLIYLCLQTVIAQSRSLVRLILVVQFLPSLSSSVWNSFAVSEMIT